MRDFVQPEKAAMKRIRHFPIAVVAFILMNLHLWTLDKLFLRQGRLRRLLQMR